MAKNEPKTEKSTETNNVSEVETLRQQLAEKDKQLTAAHQKIKISQDVADKFTSQNKVAQAQASAGPQPDPSLVRPGHVWDHKEKKAIPIDAFSNFRFKITAPNKAFNAEKGGVTFRDGVGYTNDADLIDWFANTLKYEVEEQKPPKAEEPKA